MERQRSFSIKGNRFLLFCLTIASSVLFISFCSIWVSNLTPVQQTLVQFNTTIPVMAVDSPLVKQVNVVQIVTDRNSNFSGGGFKGLILTGTRYTKPQSTSGSASVSNVPESVSGSLNLSAVGMEDPVLNQTLVRQPQIASGSNETSVESQMLLTGVNVSNQSWNVSDENSVLLIEPLRNASVSLEAGEVDNVCDFTKGEWVFDESYPLYTNRICPFIDEGFDCLGNGRPDTDFLKWRWQPQSCFIPRFNASNMLEMIRGKRLIFVGDSINRNQFESMLCLMMGAVKDPKRVYETHKRKITKEKGNYSFRFQDYGCTVEYYVSHFLVHEGKARVGQKRRQVLRIDSIDRGSSRWKGADILVFNTAHWWSHDKTKAGTSYFQEMGHVHPHLDVSTAFRKALTTWASWVDKNINPRKTQVFFRSSAPSHFRGGLWNTGGSCSEATQPFNRTIPIHTPEKNLIVDDVLKQMKTPVTFLNITSLSEYRVDAHPSIYGKKLRSSNTRQDCSHWCLPGVPDTWNQLLYFHLLTNQNLKPTM